MENAAPLRWSAYEREHIERGKDWYVALGIAAICVAVISVLLGNTLFGILILVAAFTLAIVAKHPPVLTEFELSDRGIKVGETMYKYEDIISFWVEDHEVDPPLLLVDTTQFMSPNLIIPIEHIDPAQVRAYLTERIDEVPMKEPIAHKILEFFGL